VKLLMVFTVQSGRGFVFNSAVFSFLNFTLDDQFP